MCADYGATAAPEQSTESRTNDNNANDAFRTQLQHMLGLRGVVKRQPSEDKERHLSFESSDEEDDDKSEGQERD